MNSATRLLTALARWVPLTAIVALGVGVALFYVFDMPWVAELRGWFYRPWDKALDPSPEAIGASLLGVATGVAATVAWRRRDRSVAVILLLVAATSLQLGTSLLGSPSEIMRRHESGHGKYWRVVQQRRDRWLETLTDYEALARSGALDDYAPSKPPGVLLPYMAIDSLGRVPAVQSALGPWVDRAGRSPRTRATASSVAASIVLFPVLTALTVVPLLLLGMQLFRDEDIAWSGAVVWAVVPATLLIQYHLDGAVYPLVAVTGCALAATGVRRGSWIGSALAGLTLAFGLYLSFSLVLAVALAFGCILTISIDRVGSTGSSRPLLSGAVHACVVTAGLGIGIGALAWGLDFGIVERWTHAMAYHAKWKAGVPAESWRWIAMLEWGLYVGLPLMALWLWQTMQAATEIARRRLDPAAWFTGILFALVLALSLRTGTNEVCRMWLFLNPFVALSVAPLLPSLDPGERPLRPLTVLILTQLLVAIVMKGHQEW